jgi:hypothetical protein
VLYKIQVDENTEAPVPRDSEKINYKSFEGLEVMKDMDFVNNFFGKYPVMKLNFFGTLSETSKVSAQKCCKTVIHKAFEEHKYLGSSVHLGEGEKRTCMSWCDDQEYKKKDFEDAVEGLDLLAKYLHKHHKEKAFMLVDEYDSLPVRASLEQVRRI